MSESNKVESFKCENCSAPIDYDNGGKKTVKCPYCGSIQTVPENLLPPPAPLRIDFQPAQFTRTPTESTMVKTTAVTGAGCVLGSVVLPIVILAVVGIFVVYILNSVTGMFDSVTSSVMPQMSTASALGTAARTISTRTPFPSSTHAPTPTPGYAVKVMSFGGKGVAPGKLTDARSIGVDGKGNVYVADYSGGRVQVFDATGQYVSQFKSGNSKSITTGFAVDRKGVVYMPENGVVVRYNGLTGEKIGPLAYNSEPGSGFAELCTTPDGGLVAMWYQRRNGLFTSRDGAREDMARWDANGKVTLKVQAPIGDQTDNLELDNTPVVDQQGNIYIYAGNETSIFKFSPEGKYQSRFGSAGDQPGQFSNASGIAIDNQGMLYVLESSRVSMFATDGRFVRRFPIEGSARGLALDDQDSLYITDGSMVTKYVLGK